MTASPTLSPTPAPIADNAGQSYIMATLICLILLILSCVFVFFLLHSKSVYITQKIQYIDFRKLYLRLLKLFNIPFTDPRHQKYDDSIDI